MASTGKKLVLLNADGSEATYVLNLLTLDQAEALIGTNPPAPDMQRRNLLGACLGLEDAEVGSIPLKHSRELLDQVLVLNGLKAAKGADGTTSGEAQITTQSAPS